MHVLPSGVILQMKKLIDSFLDTLLVIGAIACILTIGGGRWLGVGYQAQDPGVLVSYPLMDGSQPLNQSGNGIYGTNDASNTNAAASQGLLCPPYTMTSGDDWADSYLFRMNYMTYMQNQNQSQARALACR